jgi:hypothetical protein
MLEQEKIKIYEKVIDSCTKEINYAARAIYCIGKHESHCCQPCCKPRINFVIGPVSNRIIANS